MNPRIRYSVHPWIHPKDAKTAIFARLSQRRNRRGVSEQRIVEDLFIADLANRRPWSREQILQIQECSSDRNFCERFARALEQGKSPMFDKYDLLILSNWRQLRLAPNAPESLPNQPGLRDWSPLAIEGLFAHEKIEADCKDGNFDDWFRKRRKRLDLRGNKPYQIKKFIVKGDSITIVR